MKYWYFKISTFKRKSLVMQNKLMPPPPENMQTAYLYVSALEKVKCYIEVRSVAATPTCFVMQDSKEQQLTLLKLHAFLSRGM
jgi:hypothetical protein